MIGRIALPDWRDASNYPDADDWTWYRWRWEFLRRRMDYQTAFFERALASHAVWVDRASRFAASGDEVPDDHPDPAFLLPPPPIDSADFIAYPVNEGFALFDYFGLPNPKYSDVPEHLLIPIHCSLWSHARLIETSDLVEIWKRETTVSSVLPDGFIAIRFDLRSNISTQLKELREYLEAEVERAGFSAEKRLRPEKWPTYLRILDGREVGATWSELAEILPNWISDRSPQSARNYHDQAKQLQHRIWPLGEHEDERN